MWSCVYPVILLLASIQWAEAQGINDSPCFLLRVSSMCLLICREREVLSHIPDVLFSGRCNNVQAADIVFLIDGSSSIGRAHFQQVKGFLTGIVKPFARSVSASGIHFGAIQYSDNSR